MDTKKISIEPEIRRKFEEGLNTRIPNLVETLGIEYDLLSRTRVEGSMPVDGRTVQPFGLLHGGASVALAESLASLGAWLSAREGYAAVGMEINANHIRPVRKGRVKGVATAIHQGSSTQVWRIEIREEDSRKLVCESRCTLAIVKQ